MEDVVFTTQAHAYTVTLAPFITYDQYIEIQKVWMGNTKINVKNTDAEGHVKPPEIQDIDANMMHEANKIAVNFLVKKIVDSTGKEVVRAAGGLPIHPADGVEVMDKIDKITTEAADAFDKKKVTT